MTMMVRSAASFEEAPMKLAPPYLEVIEGESHASIDMCGCEDAAQEHSYLALVGGRHCASYEVRATDITDITDGPTCHELAHSSSNGETAAQTWATEMSPHHFEYGSCTMDEYVDFSLTLDESDYHYNYLIEVEDLSQGRGTNPPAGSNTCAATTAAAAMVVVTAQP